MKFLSTCIISGVTALTATAVVQAQHSYLPATRIGGTGKIETFAENASETAFVPDRVITNLFETDLGNNVYQAGGPSGFLNFPTNPDLTIPYPAGYQTLTANTDFNMTVPVLAHPQLHDSGNLLYWDGTGEVDFHQPATQTTVTLQHSEKGSMGILDGSEVAVVVESSLGEPYDTSNADGGRSGHFHFRYDVVGNETDATAEAPDGIYLLGHIVSMTGFEDSDIVYAPILKGEIGVFGAAFVDAISFVETTLVPEPTTGLILVAGAAGLTLIGRKRSTVK